MRVLADLHHGDLYYSLQLLFEKRLGWELYRPIGLDWYHEGYWHVYPHIDTAKQFLDTETNVVPVDVHGKPLDERTWINKTYTINDGIYYVMDPTKGKINRGITLDRFKDMEFDILISSIPSHIEPFNRLINLYQPKAKHIFQIGNSWTLNQNVSNIMASCSDPGNVISDKNVVFYHQEFDLDTYNYTGPSDNPRSISSFIHYMRNASLLDHTVRAQLPDWTIKLYGAGMPNDSICKSTDIAKAIRDAGFVWHYKPGGDGFGHCVHNAFAMGRPVITSWNDYRGKLAGDLLEDGVTYFDLDKGSIVERLLDVVETNNYAKMSAACYDRFKQVVDYDQEEQQIREFLNNLR